MAEAADFSFSKPSAAALKALGYVAGIGYVSNDPTKNLTPAQVIDFHEQGLGVCIVWESENQEALKTGAAGGRADALAANLQADALMWPLSRPIYFVLEDPSQLPGVDWAILDEYAAAAKAASKRPIGGYGSQAYIEHARTSGLIQYGWQVGGWSTSVSGMCHMMQRTQGQKLPTLGQVDDNFVIQNDFGQWTLFPEPAPVPVTVRKEEVEMFVAELANVGFYLIMGPGKVPIPNATDVTNLLKTCDQTAPTVLTSHMLDLIPTLTA